MASDWNARWIGYDYDPREELGVFVFRCEFDLQEVPAEFLVRVSADNRYKLLVDGKLVSFGPQRGDILHWFYDTLDLAPFLKAGRNEVLALIWNFGRFSPMAQVSARTGFLFNAIGNPESPVNTPGAWQVARMNGWNFKMMQAGGADFYIDVGPGEIIDGRKHLDALNLHLGNLDWRKPYDIAPPISRGGSYSSPWNLVPRSIPAMKYEERSAVPVHRTGYAGDPGGHVDGAPLQAGVQIRRSVLLDYQELLCAYPRIQFEGATGTEVTVTYAERLWADDPASDGAEDRNRVEGRTVRGYQDKFILGDGICQFEPAWWRTYRYLLIEASEPCRITNLLAIETGYPLAAESQFQADDAAVSKILDVSIRTAERCAGETYFDCPYYEQLQYVGDTRIQALIGYYLGRDRQLTRSAVETLGWSRMENGLTRSRYPDRQPQIIPPFSLWWILMRQDQRLYDRAELRERGGTDAEGAAVAEAYERLAQGPSDDSFWCFADWVPDWPGGTPPGSVRATVHLLTLELAKLGTRLDLDDKNSIDFHLARSLGDAIFANITKENGLVRHRQDPDWAPCEQSEAIYRLIQKRLGLAIDPWPHEALDRTKAARCTYYFSYYKHLTMGTADYLEELRPWKEMIEDGLTTFAENPPPVRSDCHAWSAHPILGFFQIVAGVTSACQGWRKVEISPQPGSLKKFNAQIAHPDGELHVRFNSGGLEIDTPVPARLNWLGKSENLAPGRHRVP
ncbi:MAG TPA: hypothetical protein VJ835_02910 [Fimbriimonadaceae bacterium]|nr:hypothetical protein [Fimbriimonadaceae bacterium]